MGGPELQKLTQVDTFSTDQLSMEIFRFQILTAEEIKRREALKACFNNCPCCEAALKFQFQIDRQTRTVKESSYCQACSQIFPMEKYTLH